MVETAHHHRPTLKQVNLIAHEMKLGTAKHLLLEK